MLFNKDSKLIKVSASATGYYSGAEAYGAAYIPNEIYEANEDVLNEICVSAGELDGKHSDVEADIEFDSVTVEDIMTTKADETYQSYDCLEDSLFDSIEEALELSREQASQLRAFNSQLWRLDKFYDYIDESITIKEDTVVQGVSIAKGTVVSFTKKNDEIIPEDFEFSFDLDIDI